jgi:cell division protein FtsB
MVRRPAPTPPDDELDAEVGPGSMDPATAPGTGRRRSATDQAVDLPDLSSLGIAGLTRRHVAWLLGAVIAAWIVIVFARQVGEAQAATARVEQMTVDNAALSTKVDALTRELDVIKRQAFVEQQARAHGLGGPKEIAFTLAEDAPPLPEDAPGSASVRLGAKAAQVSPLDRWLTLLFGAGD